MIVNTSATCISILTVEKQDIYVVYIYTALGKSDSWAKAANTAERRLVWHRLNTVPCSHFGAKKGTKTAAVEQGFFARGGKLLGVLVSLLLIEKFWLLEKKNSSSKRLEHPTWPHRHSLRSAVLVWYLWQGFLGTHQPLHTSKAAEWVKQMTKILKPSW